MVFTDFGLAVINNTSMTYIDSGTLILVSYIDSSRSYIDSSIGNGVMPVAVLTVY